MRAMIDCYAVLAFPMAAFFQEVMKVNWRKFAMIIVIALLIALNQVQTYQYRYRIIHWEEMSKQAYWYVFLKLHLTEDQERKLQTLLDPIGPEIRR